MKKPTALQTTKKAVQDAFSQKCYDSHKHCSIEGAAPGYGSRSKYLENFQPGLAATLAAALAVPEPPQLWEHVNAVGEQRRMTGELVRLYTEHHQEAVRTVQRLHRNLGHPSTEALTDLLTARGASEAVLNVAKSYKCLACAKYCKPNQSAPAVIRNAKEFNDQIQADVFYIKLQSMKHPVMSIIDTATKYVMACVVHKEDAEHYIKALEKMWIRHFGVPMELVADEGRPWLGGKFEEWTSSLGLHHKVAPGEAHERIALVERRHQVLRKAVEIYMDDLQLTDPRGIKEALTYIVPQQNAVPSVSGFSPSQWVLGKQPRVPGELLGEGLSPVHINGNRTFEEELRRRTLAKTALAEADADSKLRRALTRKYKGQNEEFHVGEKVWFWRDAKSADLVKIRWLGPAVVVLREEENGVANTYWLAYKTQLIRCAPHHVRGDVLGR